MSDGRSDTVKANGREGWRKRKGRRKGRSRAWVGGWVRRGA